MKIGAVIPVRFVLQFCGLGVVSGEPQGLTKPLGSSRGRRVVTRHVDELIHCGGL